MTLRASCAGITLLALLGSDVVASAMDDNKREPNIKTAEAIELFVSCENSYPLLSVKWDNGDIEKTAETVSAFLAVPSATPQVIIDKAKQCFSALKGERAGQNVDADPPGSPAWPRRHHRTRFLRGGRGSHSRQ